MIIASHVIMSCYGFWLPNDPRGSWSDFVGAWELFRYGKATKVSSRESVAHAPHDWKIRRASKGSLRYSPVVLNGLQARAVARGFGKAAEEGGYSVHACAILPEHVHQVIGKHERPIGQIVGHLKGRASQQLRAEGLHPFEALADQEGAVPRSEEHTSE